MPLPPFAQLKNGMLYRNAKGEKTAFIPAFGYIAQKDKKDLYKVQIDDIYKF